MDFRPKAHLPNPRATCNPVSKLFQWWMMPLFRKGYKRDLTQDDMYDALYEDQAEKLGDRLMQAWEKQMLTAKGAGRQPRFYKTIFSVFGPYYAFVGIFLAIDEWVIRVAQTLYLKWLIESFSLKRSTEPDIELERYLYAAGVVLTTLFHTLVVHPIVLELQHIGMKCRVSSSSIIYRKALKLSKSTHGQTSIGQLVNLLSNDVNRFDPNLLHLHFLLVGPVQMIIFSYFLYEELGPSSFAGTGFICLLMPMQYYIGKLFMGYRHKIAKWTDERGRIMNEIIIAIRVIKMYGWETPFSNMISNVRKLEVKQLRKTAYLRAFYLSLFISSAKVITFLTFVTYVLTGHTLTANKVFFAVSTYNVMRQVMVSFVPTAAAAFGELLVSLNRIETFLLLDEQKASENLQLNPNLQEVRNENNNEEIVVGVQMVNATSHWTEEKVTLDRISINVTGNKLVVVVGPVGSGKTSLLHALLAELPIKSGKCVINGRTAYAGQEPWIFSGNLRQNILFGQEFDQQKYDEIVHVCALEDDLKQLPYGDNTVVGERGVALSGGQKARVNLARALYQSADIYMMDDPLSAVDSRVSRHIFEKCIKNHLRDHLRILVTHQLQYLPQADHIILFNEGQILAQGTYQELVEQGIDFVSLLANESGEDRNRKESVIKTEEKVVEEVVDQGKPDAQVEAMAGGAVNLKLYWEYFSSGVSNLGFFILCFSFIFTQVLFSFSEYWLSKWTNDEERHVEHPEDDRYLGRDLYIWIYSGLTITIFGITKFRGMYFFHCCMNISIKVHDKMFGSLVRAPTKFFDNNPSGRLMNRFTKDLASMDELLPAAFFDALAILISMVGAIVVVVISNYYVVVATVILVVLLYLSRMFYIRTARHVKRIESVAKSPVFTHLTASMQGLTTIRSSGSQHILISQFDGHQNTHSSAWFIFIAANRWFGIWLEMISVLFLTAVSYSFILISSGKLGGEVGLAISSTLALTGSFQWGMRQSTETENLMTSVERALEYAKVEPEAPLESNSKKRPPKDWPTGGNIEFKNVSLAYEEKDVLKDLSFGVEAREKIGIVGRTGAGKSSIITALFRMTEPRGNIFIDGVCINSIGLHDLRRNISIIPQDPVLFSGTVRYNLDPFSQFKDDELWTVLEEVELKEAIPALDFKVSDGGNNFSVGQRQLVCLGRAMLRRNRIIVMDEATANVDPRTDNFIQSTIRSRFADCTIVTIAHRLHSVMDCDRILVLDNGHLKEYDHPHILLQNPDGFLTSMVGHTGNASSEKLKQVAADTYFGRRSSCLADGVDFLKSVPTED